MTYTWRIKENATYMRKLRNFDYKFLSSNEMAKRNN